MCDGNERRAALRCKPGEFARITAAWNRSLIGRVVLIGSAHSETEWNVTLLGEPGVTLTKNKRRLIASNGMVAYDDALEPLRGADEPSHENVTYEGEAALRRHRDSEPGGLH